MYNAILPADAQAKACANQGLLLIRGLSLRVPLFMTSTPARLVVATIPGFLSVRASCPLGAWVIPKQLLSRAWRRCSYKRRSPESASTQLACHSRVCWVSNMLDERGMALLFSSELLRFPMGHLWCEVTIVFLCYMLQLI